MPASQTAATGGPGDLIELPSAVAVDDTAPPAGQTLASGQLDGQDDQDGLQPAPEDRPVMVVSVLGPLEVQGLRAPIRPRALTRLLGALAVCAGREVAVEALRDLIARHPDRPVSAQAVHSYAAKLRACLPEGALSPVNSGSTGYQLAPDVDVDLAAFITLADLSARAETAEQLELGLRALSLVRGPPLAEASWAGIEPLLRSVETAIENLAADTARQALAQHDARSAEAAVANGLAAIPASPALWELRLIAAAEGSRYGLERAWAGARQVLGPDAQPLASVYQRLKEGDW